MPSPSTQLHVYWLEFRYKEEMQLVSCKMQITHSADVKRKWKQKHENISEWSAPCSGQREKLTNPLLISIVCSLTGSGHRVSAPSREVENRYLSLLPLSLDSASIEEGMSTGLRTSSECSHLQQDSSDNEREQKTTNYVTPRSSVFCTKKRVIWLPFTVFFRP